LKKCMFEILYLFAYVESVRVLHGLASFFMCYILGENLNDNALKQELNSNS